MIMVTASRGVKPHTGQPQSATCESTLSSFQCSPCVPLRAHLAVAPSLPCEVSARGVTAAAARVTPPHSLLPFPPHSAASRSGTPPTLSSFTFEKKSENAATCDMRHASLNTHCATRIAQRNTPRSRSGRSECRERRGRQGKAVQAQRALRR